MTWTFTAQARLYLAAACAIPIGLLLWLDRDFKRRWGERPGERRSWARKRHPHAAE